MITDDFFHWADISEIHVEITWLRNKEGVEILQFMIENKLLPFCTAGHHNVPMVPCRRVSLVLETGIL
jgi:hypothetical protein